MKLIPVDLSDRDFDNFIKKISVNKLYLAKLDKVWVTGRWFHTRSWTDKGFAWDFNYGLSSIQGTCRAPNSELDISFKEMYEIYDEDLIIDDIIDHLSKE